MESELEKLKWVPLSELRARSADAGRVAAFGLALEPSAVTGSTDLLALINEANEAPIDVNLSPKENAIRLLRNAAEIEHAFVVQYLSAAFSLKATAPAKWRRELLKIAKEEMGHLSTVANVLALLGEKPWLGRVSYPAGPAYRFERNLGPFSLPWLMNFVAAESPADPASLPPEIAALKTGVDHVGVLYGLIYWLFTSDAIPGPWGSLADPQIGIARLADTDFADPATASKFLMGAAEWRASNDFGDPKGVHVLAEGSYSTVDEARTAALEALFHVAIQGEGPVGGSTDSHYNRLKGIYDAAKAMPSLPVLELGSNLHASPTALGSDSSLIEHPEALLLAKIFNVRYACLLALIAMEPEFDRVDTTKRDTVCEWAFFEMQESLGELAQELVDLPVKAAGPPFCSGPFELPAALPTTEAEKRAFLLRCMAETLDLAGQLTTDSPTVKAIVGEDSTTNTARVDFLFPQNQPIGVNTMAKTFKVHPAIGIARVGNSTEFFLGPETRGSFSQPSDGKYRDAAGRLRRQAVRFRVFAHDSAGGEPVEMIVGQGGLTRIEWEVHLSNKKAEWFEFAGIIGEGPGGYPAGHPRRNASITNPAARKNLIIDPLARKISADGSAQRIEIDKGSSSSPANETWPAPFTGGKEIASLGTLVTDAQGRLTVAGGFGISGTPGALPPGGTLNFDNNDNWFDDVSDGPVKARLVFDDGTVAEVTPSWIIVAPPDYAPPIENVVTMFDTVFDIGLRECGLDKTIFDAGAFQTSFKPSFTEHIYPVIKRALQYGFVSEDAQSHSPNRFEITKLSAAPPAGENPTSNVRSAIFRRLRDPDNLMASGPGTMPKLHNDGVGNILPERFRFSLTRFQYFCFKQWAAGQFIADWPGSPPAAETQITASGLDRAALEAACGGAFFPGMETGWILRDQRVYTTPFDFRFRLLPSEGADGLTSGDATKRMALPWQADFLKCSDHWWPGQRPNQVKTPLGFLDWGRGPDLTSHVALTNLWPQMGIVVPDPANPGEYIESERTLPE